MKGVYMGANVGEAVKNSVLDVFQTMLMMEATGECVEHSVVRSMKFDVSGIIGFAGGCTGGIGIHMAKSVALKLTTAMLGVELDEVSAEVEDAIGELANMTAGGSKTALANEGLAFDISLPTVVVGDEHTTSQVDQGGESGAVKAVFPDGELFIEYTFIQEG